MVLSNNNNSINIIIIIIIVVVATDRAASCYIPPCLNENPTVFYYKRERAK